MLTSIAGNIGKLILCLLLSNCPPYTEGTLGTGLCFILLSVSYRAKHMSGTDRPAFSL